MNTQLIGSQAVKLLSKLTGQDLTVNDITPQVVFMTDLIALLKGVIHADAKVSEDEVAHFKATLGRIGLTNRQTIEIAKLLLSGVQKFKLHSDIDDFLILLVPLSEAEKLLLFGLGYRMAIADSSLDESESKYLRDLGKRLEIESRYLDVLESSFAGKSYNNQDFQEICDLVDPSRFHDLGTVFVNAADDLLSALNQLVKTEIKEPQNIPSPTNSVSGEYQKLQGFQLQKQSLLKRINHLSQLIDDGIKESLLPVTFRDEIQAIKDKLESQRFRVAVIGDFSTGKSTLLNALLGEKIQPTSALPCSGTISILKYGETKRVICRYRDDSEEEVPLEEYKSKAAMSKQAALEDSTEEILNNNIKEIIFEHPNLSLCRNGVEIIDTLGLNHCNEATEVTLKLIQTADAIIFTSNAGQLLNQGEKDALRSIKQRYGNKPLENLFLVVNFMDNLDDDEEIQEVQDRANKFTLDELISGSDRVHFISAKLALKAIINNSINEYLDSFQHFTKILESFLTDEIGLLVLQSSNQKLDELTQKCISNLNHAINNVDQTIDPAYKQEILEKIGEASGRFISICNEVKISNERAKTSALESWKGNINGDLKNKIIKVSDNWKTVHNPIFSRDKLVNDAIRQFNEALKADITTVWIGRVLKPLLMGELELLDRKIKKEFKSLNLSFAILDEKVGTNFGDEIAPNLQDFDVSFIAAFAGGGAIGGGGAVAAAFFLIPAFTLAPAIITGILAAVAIAALSGTKATIDAYKYIAKKVCEECFKEFAKEEVQERIEQEIKKSIDELFVNRAKTAGDLIKQVISECENLLVLEERKQQEEVDRLRSLISSKKQEFEKSLSI
ncbi:dynamin family protein [Pseudanabaena minima]|uniref:dynamin family protein n=1 Tax=Pseudanabaena minima TaxID=890415 RepID=UPI003DA94D12